MGCCVGGVGAVEYHVGGFNAGSGVVGVWGGGGEVWSKSEVLVEGVGDACERICLKGSLEWSIRAGVHSFHEVVTEQLWWIGG